MPDLKSKAKTKAKPHKKAAEAELKKLRDDYGRFKKLEDACTPEEREELQAAGNLTFTERRILQAHRAQIAAARGIRLGRPSKAEQIHPLIKKRIIQAIENGAPVRAAFAYAGIHRTTVETWKLKGEAGIEPYASLVADLKNAEDIYIVKAATKIAAMGMSGNWTALAWTLERQHPTLFGQRSREEADAKGKSPEEQAVETVKQINDMLALSGA